MYGCWAAKGKGSTHYKPLSLSFTPSTFHCSCEAGHSPLQSFLLCSLVSCGISQQCAPGGSLSAGGGKGTHSFLLPQQDSLYSGGKRVPAAAARSQASQCPTSLEATPSGPSCLQRPHTRGSSLHPVAAHPGDAVSLSLPFFLPFSLLCQKFYTIVQMTLMCHVFYLDHN